MFEFAYYKSNVNDKPRFGKKNGPSGPHCRNYLSLWRREPFHPRKPDVGGCQVRYGGLEKAGSVVIQYFQNRVPFKLEA